MWTNVRKEKVDIGYLQEARSRNQSTSFGGADQTEDRNGVGVMVKVDQSRRGD